MVSQAETRSVVEKPAKPVSPLVIYGAVRVFDCLVVCLAGIVSYLLIVGPEPASLASQYVGASLLGAVGAALISAQFNAYSTDYLLSRWLRIKRILAGWACTVALMLAAGFALKLTEQFSRLWAGTWFAAVAVLLPAGRVALRAWLDHWIAAGRLAERVVIVGAGEHGQRLARYLETEAQQSVKVIGFIDDRATRVSSPGQHRLLGDTQRLLDLIREDAVDRVFIALPWGAEARVRELIYRLAVAPVNISLCPDFVGFNFANRPFVHVAGLPVLQVFDRPISGWAHFLKSVEDRVIAGTALLLLAPLLAIVALAIKLDSPGPVFFRQRRYGFNNKLIGVWKFRTMYADMTDLDADRQTTRDDPRVTRVGRFLRKTSIDELPQLFNVLGGTMSIVGPRPHAVATKAEGRLFEEVVDRYAARHRVKPGITGWAQINGWRGETDTVEKIQKRVEYDLFYIDNWSVWFDLVIIARTAFALVRDLDSTY
ncbi:MAG: undecaprenyl-phosphate glucose phosphotransferase [Rhodospirillaceae bacterium]|nr:undecaprenyl-phosphate glucose phosphotransferase [Rhodospirillaceae bacterium]